VTRFSSVLRLSIGLVLLTCSILLVADLVGVMPAGGREANLEARRAISESLAVQYTLAAGRGDVDAIQALIETAVARNDAILSAGARHAGGHLTAAAGDHRGLWGDEARARSTATHISVPLFSGDERWGALEVHFTAIDDDWLGIPIQPVFRLVVFVALVGFVGYLVILNRALRRLDPMSVVPGRVKAAMETLAEGVAVVDPRFRS